jgi:hypothetical protein
LKHEKYAGAYGPNGDRFFARGVASNDVAADFSCTPRGYRRIAGVGPQRLDVGRCWPAGIGQCARHDFPHAQEQFDRCLDDGSFVKDQRPRCRHRRRTRLTHVSDQGDIYFCQAVNEHFGVTQIEAAFQKLNAHDNDNDHHPNNANEFIVDTDNDDQYSARYDYDDRHAARYAGCAHQDFESERQHRPQSEFLKLRSVHANCGRLVMC